MPTVKDQAICIRHWDWSETSQTVSLFCAQHGIVRGLAKGSRRENAPFSGGIELLTRGEAMVIIKSAAREGGSLATLTAWDLQDPCSGLRRSLRALHSAMFLADLVHHSLHDLDPHPILFASMVSALAALERGDSPARIVLGFQWQILSDCGYRPEILTDARSGNPLPESAVYLFSARLGGLIGAADVREPHAPSPGGSTSPANHSFRGAQSEPDAWKVRPDTVEVLRKLAGSPETVDYGLLVADTSLSDEAILRCSALLASYFRFIHQVWPPSIRWILPDHPHLGERGSEGPGGGRLA